MKQDHQGRAAGDAGREELFHILMEELSAYNYLVETVEAKQQAIIHNNLEQVEHLSGVEQLIVNKVNQLIRNRHSAMKKVMHALGVEGMPLTLSGVINRLQGRERERWQRIENHIASAVEKIQKLNLQNMRLLDTSLKYVRGMIDMFVPVDEDMSSIYTKQGQNSGRKMAKNLLDCNA